MKLPGIICWIGALVIGFLLVSQSGAINRLLHLKEERAQALNIRYGLLSLDEWKAKSFAAVSGRINDFSLSGNDRATLRPEIRRLLRDLLDEARAIVEAQRESGSWIEQALRGVLQDLIIDFDALYGEIPEFTEKILDELGNTSNQQQVKSLIINKLKELLELDAPRLDQEIRDYYKTTYGCADLEACGEVLSQQISPLKKNINAFRPLFLTIASVCVCIFLIGGRQAATKFNITGLVALCSVLLVGGILLPMISVDARILDFKFEMLGMNVNFQEQVLFYQSKSVINIVTLLYAKGTLDTLLVAALILLFSVLFPLSKLLLSVVVSPRSKSPMVDYLTTKASKWSMADVFVVAIVMGFIGLRSIISSQMEQIGTDNPFVDLIATDYTSLNVGFTLFLLFCLCSLVLGKVTSDYLSQRV